MYQANIIQECLRGLVGFSQPSDPSYSQIDNDLTLSSSGLFVENAHNICIIENLKEVAPQFEDFQYPEWATGNNYKAGTYVIYEYEKYRVIANVNNSTITPDNDETHFIAADPFSDWLRVLTNQSSVNLITNLVREKKYNEVGKSLVDTMQLFKGPGALSDQIIKQGRFVGWQLDINSTEGLAAIINKIGFQADQAQEELNIYLYNSNNTEPVIFPIEIIDAGSFQWSDIANCIIGYMRDNNTDSQSSWFLGYYEDDLTGSAIRREINLSNVCQTCERYNYDAFMVWGKFVRIRPIEVPASGLRNDNSLFDLSKIKYAKDTNFGMNLYLSVQCDISQIICRNKNIFADVLAMQIALDCLNKIAFNTRIGAISDRTKKLAMSELDDNPASGSFKVQYNKALAGMSLDFSGLNAACLPCEKKNVITHRAIGIL